ncbi:unnamed protein product [Rotaria sp. Silwood1]|nr:unnamed protein product [Rotaria sp. Silwood1]
MKRIFVIDTNISDKALLPDPADTDMSTGESPMQSENVNTNTEILENDHTEIKPSTPIGEPQTQTSGTTDQITPTHNTSRPYIMISYHRKSSFDTCQRICTQLRSRGYNVWMDEDDLNGNILYEELALAIENASIVLICFNRQYAESDFCRKEACYTVRCGIDYIPCRMEAPFRARGWLGIIISDHLYCDFSSPNEFNNDFERLFRQIRHIEANSKSNSTTTNTCVALSPVPSISVNNRNIHGFLRTIIRIFRETINQTDNPSVMITQEEFPMFINFICQHVFDEYPSTSTTDNNNSQQQQINNRSLFHEILINSSNQTEFLTNIAEILATITEPTTIIKLYLVWMFCQMIREFL